MENHTYYMNAALELARQAGDDGEVPVGCVVVRRSDGAIVGRGRNRREKGKNALFHAEMLAIDDACAQLGGWRLWDCELYVTLEPCPMCAGAIMNARIAHVVYGATDPKSGAVGSVVDLFAERWNHRPSVTVGVQEEECAALLQEFFARLRSKKR